MLLPSGSLVSSPRSSSFLNRCQAQATPHARTSPMAAESIIKFCLLAAFLTGIGRRGILMNQTLLCIAFVHPA